MRLLPELFIFVILPKSQDFYWELTIKYFSSAEKIKVDEKYLDRYT